MANPTETSQQAFDLALAAELQAALLPQSCPTDCPNHVAAARNRMCAVVGGDFHNFIRVNEDQIAVVIGDVVGHGVRASLVMAQIMTMLRSEVVNLSRPAQVMTAVNNMLIELSEKTGSVLPCSLLYGVIDTPTGLGLFVNAGHPRPLIFRRDQSDPVQLGSGNILLGIEPFEPEEACYTFATGDRLVMFTDGITDATNPTGDHFGKARLLEAIEKCNSDDPQCCVDGVFCAVEEFRGGADQLDDETIVVIDRL